MTEKVHGGKVKSFIQHFQTLQKDFLNFFFNLYLGESVAPLTNEVGELVTIDVERADVLNNFTSGQASHTS